MNPRTVLWTLIKVAQTIGTHNCFRTPVSVVTLLTRAAEDAPDHTALSVKRDGEWVNWSYEKYLEDVRCVAKAFIKLGLKVG